MTYYYNNSNSNDTIAAIATAPGTAAISVIRISGKDAIKISCKFFSGKVDTYKSHTVHFGKVLDENRQAVDSVLLTVMLAPKSYTGEDSVEISCHGGTIVTKKVYETIIQAGARPALPGEFTFRAFLHEKIDLLQAEAVQSLISASNEMALKAANSHLEGALSLTISDIQKEVIDIAAIIEAWVDFPEEGLEYASKEEIIENLGRVKTRLQNLCDSFHEGKILFDGITLAIIGTPNVGKSSLMNALCKKERSIVTPIAGTTRDSIEEKIFLGPYHFNIIDTAGIRKAEEMVEEEGIKRSKKIFEEADVILLVLDASKDPTDDDLKLFEQIDQKKTVVIWNKIDLGNIPPKLECKNSCHISAKKILGMEELKETILKVIRENTPPSKEEIILTQIRHKQGIEEAINSIEAARNGLNNNISAEFVASDMRYCLNHLSTIIGHDVTEDILSAIFSKFCVGK